MFLKRLDRRKGRKKHAYWALVESYRTGKGSRHRVVAYLGELSKREKNGWEQLGRRLNGKGRPQRTLFDPPRYDDPTEEEPVLVERTESAVPTRKKDDDQDRDLEEERRIDEAV